MKVKKILCWLDRYIEPLIMSVMLITIVILIAVNVFMRKIMLSSLSWGDELARYCFIYLVMFGISYSIKKDSTIKINVLETAVPKIAPYLVILQDVVYFAFLIYMIKPACNVVAYYGTHPQKSPGLGLPLQAVHISLVIAVALSVFRMIQKYALKIREKKEVFSSEGGKES